MRSPCRRGVWLFLGCVAFFVVTNIVSFPLLFPRGPDHVLVMVLYAAGLSAIGAQMGLHGIWCVLAPLPWAKRFLVGATSGLVLYGSVAVGWIVVPSLRHELGESDLLIALVTGLLCLPLLLLAAQVPLWIMRIWFRWRIAHRDDVPSATLRPLRIGHLLLAMATIAAALAAARISQSISASPGNDGIVVLAVAALVIMVISAITVLPAVLAGLYARRLPLAHALAFAADVAVVVGYVALFVALGGERLEWEIVIFMAGVAGGFFATLTVPMLIARRLGYRLLWGRG